MNVVHLGDTNDLAKRPLMEILAPIEEWVVVPMFEGGWPEEDIQRYRRIVSAQLSNMDVLVAANRTEVLSTKRHDRHAFFDPTTGVSLPTAANPFTPKLICVTELAAEALRRPNRLTISYDQSRNRKMPLQVEREMKLSFLSEEGVAGFIYVAQAPYLIASPDNRLVDLTQDNLVDAGIPESRIFRLP